MSVWSTVYASLGGASRALLDRGEDFGTLISGRAVAKEDQGHWQGIGLRDGCRKGPRQVAVLQADLVGLVQTCWVEGVGFMPLWRPVTSPILDTCCCAYPTLCTDLGDRATAMSSSAASLTAVAAGVGVTGWVLYTKVINQGQQRAGATSSNGTTLLGEEQQQPEGQQQAQRQQHSREYVGSRSKE
jgi:hypothetical protein